MVKGYITRLFNPANPILFCISALSILLSFSEAQSMVTSGNCSDCHTMHNSQDGEPTAYQLNSSYSGFEANYFSNEFLLISDCTGCHTSTGNSTIVNNVPVVFNTGAFNNPLAGGNFNYVRTDDANGHNVTGIKQQDAALGITPPGGSAMSSQLTCAGEYGCHGNRNAGKNDYTAMEGAHHEDDTAGITGTSAGLSYRFLKGIHGKEDSNWEQDNTNTSHNEYKGLTASSSNKESISYLCAVCHGNFHTWEGGASEVGTQSPWLRHPTDIELKSTDEYASYTTYSMVAPVARPDPGSVADTTTVTPGTDVIMCLSCHRAHASPYYKMLRWDYKNTDISTALSGCNICHTSKN